MILGIDDGTTAVKVALFDDELREIASARRPVPTSNPAPGRVEQDAEAVLEAVVDAVAEVLPAAEGRAIQGVGLDHQGESVLAWDPETGTPRSPIVVWQDKRGSEAYDNVAPDLLARTGLPPDPYFSAPKLSWLVREVADVPPHAGASGDADGVAARAGASGGAPAPGGVSGAAGGFGGAAARGGAAGDLRLGTVDAFLCDRLGAGSATDASTASRTALQSLAAPGVWDADLCAAFGVPRDALPALAPTTGDLGVLRHPRWGDVALPLRARVCDQQAALAGAGCVRPGMTKATYGTGVFVLAHAGSEVPRAEGLLPTVAWQSGGRVEYALDGGVFTAGALLEWLTGTLGLAADPIALDALAASVPDTAGVRVLPALAGAGAPYWRPEARALIAGLTAAATPANIARAAFEAIAHRVADILDATPTKVGVLRVDGGLTNSALLCQLQADLAQVPVERGTPDTTVTGAAGLALVGAGVLPDTTALESLAPTLDRFEPRIPPGEAASLRASWRTFAAAALNL